jgi:integrase
MSKNLNPQFREPDFTSDLPAIPKAVISLSREFIDTTGDRWSFRSAIDGGDLVSINWRNFAALVAPDGRRKAQVPARTIHLARLFAADRLTRKASGTVIGEVHTQHIFLEWLFNSEQCTANSLQWASIRESQFRNFFDHFMLTTSRGSYFQRVRFFYQWGVRQGFPDFDAQLLRNLKSIRAPGCLTGHHVRSQSPRKGPFYREEVDLIVAAIENDVGTAEDQAIVTLFLELGMNPSQAARLRNEDLILFEGTINGITHTEYQLRVPRTKKRRPYRETKQRAISPRLANLLLSVQTRGARTSWSPSPLAAYRRPH